MPKYISIGNQVAKIYCVTTTTSNDLFTTETLDDLNMEINRLVDLYYFGRKKRKHYKFSIFLLKNVDPAMVEKSYLNNSLNVPRVDVYLKKTKVRVYSNRQNLPAETIFKNQIVTNIVSARNELDQSPKKRVHEQYKKYKLNIEVWPVSKKKMVNNIMEYRELPLILKRS